MNPYRSRWRRRAPVVLAALLVVVLLHLANERWEAQRLDETKASNDVARCRVVHRGMPLPTLDGGVACVDSATVVAGWVR